MQSSLHLAVADRRHRKVVRTLEALAAAACDQASFAFPDERETVVQRQFPKPAEIFEVMKFKKPQPDAKKRRLDAALTVYDLRAIAKRRTPRAAFDYTDGAAEEELSLARARRAFQDIEFNPGILRGSA